ncbi:uncharacterized protein LOC132054166 [Lycium ferocissimum]|uniref:uncharacterized protein LOC132054166 n=1 Tax=Lycium ferocissimum TaxID=112874 RepID=UPI002816482A|nr:uncharacterized protein LOC132054166 [Lycium ferocissimum]
MGSESESKIADKSSPLVIHDFENVDGDKEQENDVGKGYSEENLQKSGNLISLADSAIGLNENLSEKGLSISENLENEEKNFSENDDKVHASEIAVGNQEENSLDLKIGDTNKGPGTEIENLNSADTENVLSTIVMSSSHAKLRGESARKHISDKPPNTRQRSRAQRETVLKDAKEKNKRKKRKRLIKNALRDKETVVIVSENEYEEESPQSAKKYSKKHSINKEKKPKEDEIVGDTHEDGNLEKNASGLAKKRKSVSGEEPGPTKKRQRIKELKFKGRKT